MELILYLIIGGIVGWVAGLILGKDLPGGFIGNIVAGIVGAWIGGEIGLFTVGPVIAGIQLIPALIGAIILIIVVSFILKAVR
ncbi:GlsB/YeaQ/YmgE family stress response membrane protein [Paenisporosarcina sp. TG20]|uniref:GlsB/YeaQ/YmgE family stress response membrane protein n=1 Tax=Paenisporosarcina sp. TG20 TaxID=1211706 RepID=UPI0002FD0F60|nr:GlsB/YeaQ/YmgE family stress response membrane protein [Paenisporosarcina sp. TG20]